MLWQHLPGLEPIHLYHVVFSAPDNPFRTVDTTLVSGGGEATGSITRDGSNRHGHEVVRVELGVLGPELTRRCQSVVGFASDAQARGPP